MDWPGGNEARCAFKLNAHGMSGPVKRADPGEVGIRAGPPQNGLKIFQHPIACAWKSENSLDEHRKSDDQT